MPSQQRVDEVIKQLAVSVPPGYREFLVKHDGKTRFTFDGRDWIMLGVDSEHGPDILSMTHVDGRKPVFGPFILSQYAASLREFLGTDSTNDQDSNDFSLERLAKGFAIGDDNGDVLFVDSENGAVYCWYPDGMDVKRLADSFAAFITKAQRTTY